MNMYRPSFCSFFHPHLTTVGVRISGHPHLLGCPTPLRLLQKNCVFELCYDGQSHELCQTAAENYIDPDK